MTDQYVEQPSRQNCRTLLGLLIEKQPFYAKSSYHLSAALADNGLDEWTPAALDDRQQKLARRAAHIWRSDFDQKEL
ncbi:MAG TPA: hypothetical protein VFN66_10350 [Burkholderiales bacterium]|nr:hypothetical protein [Burkholderiales bacterium]